MRRALLVGLAALAVVPAAGATPGFRYGVAAGEMTSTSALLWTRSNELGPVRLFVWPAPRKGMPFVQIDAAAVGRPRPGRPAPRPRAQAGHALHVSVLGAVPEDARSRPAAPSGRRRSRHEPRPSASRSAATRTAPAIRAPGSRATTSSRSTAGWRPSRTTSTSTSATRSTRTARSAASPPALTIPAKWAKYKAEPRLRAPAQPPPRDRALQPLGRPRVHQRLLAAGARQAGLPSRRRRVHRTTHPFPTRAERPLPQLPLGQEPRALLPRRALVPLGEGARDLQERPRADGAASGAERLRGARAVAGDPGAAALSRRARRTRRGRCSARASTRRSRRRSSASTATWKVIVNEVPIQQFFALPYDRWEGYPAEREKLLRFLQKNVKNVLFLATTRTRTSSTRCG